MSLLRSRFEGGGRAELDNLFNSYHSIYNHDMNGYVTRCIAELRNKQDKLEKAVDELRSRAPIKFNK